jgi:hypothetical protein
VLLLPAALTSITAKLVVASTSLALSSLTVLVRFVAASMRTVAVGQIGTSPNPPLVPEKMADAKPSAAWSSTGRAKAERPSLVNVAYHAMPA